MKTIYRFVILSDEEESFVREIEMLQNHTFLDFHKAIQTACDFDHSQMTSFFLVDNNWNKLKELTLENLGDDCGQFSANYMGKTYLKNELKFRKQKLLYVFDFFTERVLFIYLRDIYPAKSEDLLPRLVYSRGKPPQPLKTGEAYIDNLLTDFSSN